jgi:thiamine biosynthesis lipoprotein
MRTLAAAACAALVAAAVGCRGSSPAATGSSAPRLITDARLSMGTEVRISAWTADSERSAAAFNAAFGEFERLDGLMTTWRPTSDIVRLNDAAGEHPVPVSPEVIDVLTIAHQVSEWTDGAFDVTFGAFSDVWKFDQDQDNTIPSEAEIRARLPLVNYRDLIVDPVAGTAWLARKGMKVNLGGIGKGYAIDRAAAILRARGLNDFMIQAGGDLYVAGLHDGKPWRLGIRDPRGSDDQIFAAIDLSNGTFSTSGDYERYFIKNGRRYHHIIDVRTGQPARACRSVTLVTDRAVIADGLSTGIFILGPEKGLALMARLPHVEGVIVSAANKVFVSPGLTNRLVLLRPPTDGL